MKDKIAATFNAPFYHRLLIVAVIVHLCAAWFSHGYYQIDEHHQILEYAALKEGVVSEKDILWYEARARSMFQPFIAYSISQVLSAIGVESPFLWAAVLRLLSVALALAAALLFFVAHQEDLKYENTRRWMLAAMLLLWVLVFYHARFSSEGWMASLMLAGLAFWRMRGGVGFLFAAGACFGLAFACRYQAGFMLLPLAVFALWREKPPAIVKMAAGAFCAFLLQFIIDWWFYGEPSLPWLNYLEFHLDNSANLSPWHMYLRKGGEFIPLFGYLLPLILAAFWFLFPRHALTWATVLYVAFHFYNENRQFRFMLPVLVFLPLMTAMVWEHAVSVRPVFNRVFLWLLKISAVINAPLILSAAFVPAAVEVKLLRDCILPNANEQVFLLNHGDMKSDVILRFYIRNSVEFVAVADESELAAKVDNEPVLYVARKSRAEQLRQNGFVFEAVCHAIPKWLLQYNINGWVDRASIFPVYWIKKGDENQ